MPSKEETSERLHAVLEEAEEIEETAVEPESAVNGDEPKSSSREYIVLEQGSEADIWVVVTTAEATSAEGAIRTLGADLQNETTYVAVPKRNWNPVPVKIKTTTTISFT